MTTGQIIFLLLAFEVSHWLGDFVLQTHWMASNKSKDNVALTAHALVYGLVTAAGLCAALIVMLPFSSRFDPRWMGWVVLLLVINTALHWVTDYETSRHSSRLFGQWLKDMRATGHLHDFFVMIGFDQLVHRVAMLSLVWAMLA